MTTALAYAPAAPPRTGQQPTATSTNCLDVWTKPKAWLVLYPILFLIIEGHINTGTTVEKLRLAQQINTSFERNAFVLLILGSFAVVARKGSAMLPKILESADLVGFAVLSVLSTLWSDAMARTAFNATGELAVTLLALYLVSTFKPQELMQLIILPGFIAMISSCFTVIALPNIGLDADADNAWRGVFQQKNALGMVVLFLGMPFIHLPIRGILSKSFRAVYLSLALLLIIMSRAKTAWCATLLYLGLVLTVHIIKKFRRADAAALAFLVSTGSIGLAASIYENADYLLSLLGKDPTLSQRTVIWAAVWQSITARSVLGYGYSAFWMGMNGPSLNVILISGWMLAQSQNGFLDVWLSIGVIGILLFALITFRALVSAIKCLSASSDTNLVWYSSIVVVSLFYNFSESFLNDPRSICWFLFMVACIGLRQASNLLRAAKSTRTAVLTSSHPYSVSLVSH